jgi:hypothetical protein
MFRLVRNTITTIGWLNMNWGKLSIWWAIYDILIFSQWCLLPTNSEDIDIYVVDPPTNGPPVPTPELTTDDFDIFQGVFTSYSQQMNQMTLDQSIGTSGT